MATATENNNAPIVELVVGLHFNRAVFSIQDIFSYYIKIKDRFPIIQEHPPLPFLMEKKDDPNIDIAIPSFTSRKFFINKTENKLIQLQVDKIFFNWRKTTGEEQYPHFNKVLSEFIGILNEFKPLEDLKRNINQLEVTYVDHISLDDFNKNDFNPEGIFNLINISGSVSNIGTSLSINNSDINGQLTIDLKSAINNVKKQKLFLLESNCRGQLGDKTINDWFDCAHSNIHDLFYKITSDDARLKWGI